MQEEPGRHESTDVEIKPIVLTAVGLALVAAVVLVLSIGIFGYFTSGSRLAHGTNPMAAEAGNQIPPEPRISDHPAVELQQLHAYEDQMLTTYGWVDKKAGVVRIPIDRAMDLQLQRGFPVRKEANPR